jgi:hypothetical protein
VRTMLDAVHFVILCDWRGRCTWASGANYSVVVGEYIWAHLAVMSQGHVKELLGRVVSLREPQVLEVIDQTGDRFRGR